MRHKLIVGALVVGLFMSVTACKTHQAASAMKPAAPVCDPSSFKFDGLTKTPVLTAVSHRVPQGATARVEQIVTPTSKVEQFEPADEAIAALSNHLQVVLPPVGQKYDVAGSRAASTTATGVFVLFSSVSVVSTNVQAKCAGAVRIGRVYTWVGDSDGIFECDPKFSPPPLPLADAIREKGCDAK